MILGTHAMHQKKHTQIHDRVDATNRTMIDKRSAGKSSELTRLINLWYIKNVSTTGVKK